MTPNSTSPTFMPTLSAQLQALQTRQSVVNRLIRCLELYQRVTPVQNRQSKTRVA
jgi:hypothetical protein